MGEENRGEKTSFTETSQKDLAVPTREMVGGWPREEDINIIKIF